MGACVWPQGSARAFSQPLCSIRREDGPTAFPGRQGALPTALFHPMPIRPRAQAGPEVRIYDANTGKLIRKGAVGPGPPSPLPSAAELSSFRYLCATARVLTGVFNRGPGPSGVGAAC